MEHEIKGYKMMMLGLFLDIGMMIYFFVLFFFQDITMSLFLSFTGSLALSAVLLVLEAYSIKKINVTRRVLPLLLLLPLMIVIDVFVFQWTFLSPFGQALIFIGAVRAANQGLSYYEQVPSKNKQKE